jgi:hypothetical protein
LITILRNVGRHFANPTHGVKKQKPPVTKRAGDIRQPCGNAMKSSTPENPGFGVEGFQDRHPYRSGILAFRFSKKPLSRFPVTRYSLIMSYSKSAVFYAAIV